MKRNLCAGSVLLALVPLLTSSTALALANRVFVSARSGNNANSCDNILTPCQTFAGAVLQLNPGGEAIVLDSGGYGPVTITQSVTIEAPPGVLAFIHPPSGHGITVNAAGAKVVLRGLTIDGAAATTGSGIHVLAVSVLHVESCVVTGFSGNAIQDGQGINFFSAGKVFVKDFVMRECVGFGIWVAPSTGTASATLDHCRLEGNGNGLLVDANAKVAIQDSVSSGNGAGLVAQNGGELSVEGCVLASNNGGLVSTNAAVLRASNCTITDNTEGLLSSTGGALLSRSNNTLEGNGIPGAFTGFYSAH